MVAGVTSSASSVPRSHSRAMTSAVSRAPISVMMIATSPGTRKFRLFNSLLNQMRCSIMTGVFSCLSLLAARRVSQLPQAPSR